MKGRQVGESITAKFNEITGSVELYANNGVLWNNWVEQLGVQRDEIKSIHVAEGTAFLPEDVRGFDSEEWHYTMLGGLTNAELIDMRRFDTSRVITMTRMFTDCSKLRSLCLNNFNTSRATDMDYMFYNCYSLASLNLSNFNTSNATNMACMFYNCGNLTELNLGSFDTSRVTNMDGMFFDCENLTGLDLSGFDTSNVTDMSYMFYGCENLRKIIMNPIIGERTNTHNIFKNCSAKIV